MTQHFANAKRSMNFASVHAFSRLGVVVIAPFMACLAGPVYAGNFTFVPGNLVVSRSVYAGTETTVTVGQTLPGSNNLAIADGLYPNVFDNATPDPSFGITSPISLTRLPRPARRSVQ